MKKLIAGNWKMNGSVEDARRLIAEIVNKVHQAPRAYDHCEFVVFPSYLHISAVKHSLTGLYSVSYGAQDCSPHEVGAYTGEVSAEMASDYGCSHVIVGHSERRTHHQETDEIVSQKASQAQAQGLFTVICVGENLQQRQNGDHENVVGEQLEKSIPQEATEDHTIIAYEPVWAIGSGESASDDDIKTMHAFIRERLSARFSGGSEVKILYGGSVNSKNAQSILATDNVDGVLVGGASLNSDEFLAIARCA